MRARRGGGPRSDGGVRAFLALELPEQLRRQLAEAQARLRQELPPARWVRPDGIHLTLKFLGETSLQVLGALAGELEPAVADLPPVEVQLAGTGCFPNPRRPRVAWIGGAARGAAEVVRVIERVASRHGFERERRAWSLHLTLARLREPWPAAAVESFLEWGDGLGLEPFTCREVVLFQSTLEPGGAVYTALQRLDLASAAPVGSRGGEA